MKITVGSAAVISVCTTMLSIVSSCVDHDYDLTKGIDKTISFGGEELTLPASSTSELRLSKVLDLDEGSSIKEAEYDNQYGSGIRKGDYVLVQDGEESNYNFNIARVEIKNMGRNQSETELPPFFNSGNVERIQVTMTQPTVNDIDISDDDVTDEIKTLQAAQSNIDIVFTVGYEVNALSTADFQGTCYIEKGYEAEFSEAWTLEIADSQTASYLEVFDNHKIRFTKQVGIEHNKPLMAHIRIVNVDFTKLPDGQGLYEVGHFRMNTQIHSMGNVSIMASEFPAMSTVVLDMVTKTEVLSATLMSVTGTFDPVINVDPTTFEITDIPDFLQNDGNNLDIDNPRFYINISNDSPLAVTLAARLEAFDNGNPEPLAEPVLIGAPATEEIVVAANGRTRICLSQKAVAEEGVQNIIVSNLTSLISSIPDCITISDVNVKAVQTPATITLGRSDAYSFTNDYEAIIPLAFGPELSFTYDDTEQDWDTDLEKYNFNEVKVTVVAVSTIPLTLTPDVEALDRDGNVMTSVTATVDGTVGGGSLDTPSRSNLVISIKSTGKNLDGLDGIRYKFTAVSDSESAGAVLNSAQSLRFEEIKLSVIGGVTIDLNDL